MAGVVAKLMLFPFRLTVAGHVACANQGSDDYIDSQIKVVCGTKIGERPMVSPYGIPDPTFSRLTVSDVQTCIDQYGPDDVSITSVETVGVGEDTVDSTVLWQRPSGRR